MQLNQDASLLGSFGNFDVLGLVLEHCSPIAITALFFVNHNIQLFMLDHDFPPVTKGAVSYLITKEPHWEFLKWAVSMGCPLLGILATTMAIHGRKDMLKWFKENGGSYDKAMTLDLASEGKFDMLRWFWENGSPWFDSPFWHKQTFQAAAAHGDIEFLRWLRTQHCPWDESVCARVAQTGNLKVLIWLKNEGCPMDVETPNSAILKGHIDVVAWALANDCPINRITLYNAAKKGYKNLLIHFRSAIRILWDPRLVMAGAAYGNHFELLQWAFGDGTVSYDGEAYRGAALNGNVKMMDWLYTTGTIPCIWWTKGLCCTAATAGKLEILKWAKDKGLKLSGAFNGAVLGDHPQILDWLKTNGLLPKKRIRYSNYISYGHFPMLNWLKKNGYEWDGEEYETAAKTNNLRMFKWLGQNGCPWEPKAALEVIKSNHLRLFNWIIKSNHSWDFKRCSEIALVQKNYAPWFKIIQRNRQHLRNIDQEIDE